MKRPIVADLTDHTLMGLYTEAPHTGHLVIDEITAVWFIKIRDRRNEPAYGLLIHHRKL